MNSGTVFVINGVTVDLGNEVLCDRSGNDIALRPQCFAVLLLLIRNANRLVSKDELMTAVWSSTFVTDDSLVQCIHEIRRALNDEGHAVLKTVLKRGYRLVLPVGIGVVADDVVRSAAVMRHDLWRPLLFASAALMLFLAVITTWWQRAGSAMLSSPFDKVAAAPMADTASLKAYDALLVGLEYLHRDTEEDTLTAISMFERAIKFDPRFGRAHAAIAAAQLRILVSPWYAAAGAGQRRAYGGFHLHLAKAMEQPTSLSYAVAAARALQTGQPGEAFTLIDRAMELGPHDPDVLVTRAMLLNAAGRATEAETDLRLALLADPYFSPTTLRILSMALFNQGKYLEAAEMVERLVAQGAATRSDHMTLVSSLGQLGDTDRVMECMRRFDDLVATAGWDPMSVQEAQWYWNGDLFSYHQPYVDKLVEGLRKAGVAEGAGTDVPFSRFAGLVKLRYDGALDVQGVAVIGAVRAGALYDRGARFIDVRNYTAFAQGHIPGAVNLPFVSSLSREELNKVVTSDNEIVFYCQSKNCGYSAFASAKAVTWGYSKVYLLDGGLPAWKDADCPITVASRS